MHKNIYIYIIYMYAKAGFTQNTGRRKVKPGGGGCRRILLGVVQKQVQGVEENIDSSSNYQDQLLLQVAESDSTVTTDVYKEYIQKN